LIEVERFFKKRACFLKKIWRKKRGKSLLIEVIKFLREE
jgi:hypothetical protein